MTPEPDATRLLKSFLDVGVHLTRELDIRRSLGAVVERSMELTEARYGAAATVGSDGIEEFVHRGLTPSQVADLPHEPEGKGLLGAVIDERAPIRTSDINAHPLATGFPLSHVEMKAFLGVPMLQRDELVGALYLTKPPGAPSFSAADEDLVTAMAAVTAVGIANSSLLAAERRRVEDAAALREIAWAVRHSLGVDDVLGATVATLGPAAGADRCFVRLVTGPGGTDLGPIHHEWARPGVSPLARHANVQFPISVLAAQTLSTQWSSDVASDPKLFNTSLPSTSTLLESGTSSALSTPLEWGGELLGVVTFHSLAAREWSDADITLLESAAREVSAALHHATLYAQAIDSASKLQELHQLRSDFVSMVSHELRSPMTVVSGIAHILQWRRDKLSSGELDVLLETLERESRRLGRLVSEFLDMEAIERGRISLQPQEVDLVDLAGESMIDAGHAARTELVAGAGDTTVIADRDRIKQTMLNLIGNAAKFSGDDEPITVRINPAGEEVVVQVCDRGPGIPDAEAERLFERFSRLSSTLTRAPGSGVGLFVSRVIVELHGGRIWAESGSGQGAVFSFALPRAGPA